MCWQLFFDDEAHSSGWGEAKIIIGHSQNNRCWFLSPNVHAIRIIQCPFSHSVKSRIYEQNAFWRKSHTIPDDELLDEYHFDYKEAK
jgi:hypothetical protein